MATQALYNKWRAQTFDDLLGQEHITNTLRNQIRAGRVGHAYLFTGLRGTGKTSTARIMAKAVNCIGETDSPPCNECHICHSITDGRSLDLIEIDAASNRGIDEIRDLRERVAFVPHECRYKVYVIDEVHMLTNEAFNALLKTLEEPPAHVIFILATTEPHRLPDTILSRCQRFDFRRGSVAVLVQKLRKICESEGIEIEDAALEFVARRAAGSFRDAESLLDQLASYGDGRVTIEMVQNVLGSPASELIIDIVRALVTHDIPLGLHAINVAMDSGAEPRQFLSELIDHFRGLLFLRVGSDDALEQLVISSVDALREINDTYQVSTGLLVKMLQLLSSAGQGLRYAARPQLPIELAFVEATLPGADLPATASRLTSSSPAVKPRTEPSSTLAPVVPQPQGPAPQASPPTDTKPAVTGEPRQFRESVSAQREERPAPRVPVLSSEPKRPVDRSVTNTPAAPQQEAPALETQAKGAKGQMVEPRESEQSVPQRPRLSLEMVQGNWSIVLLKMQSQSKNIRALLNSAYPIQVRQDQITLGCEGQFHKSKLSEEKRRALVEDVLSDVLGVKVSVECITSNESVAERESRAVPPPPSGGLFAGQAAESAIKDELRNHPTVKALERRGGQIVDIQIKQDKEGEQHGQ